MKLIFQLFFFFNVFIFYAQNRPFQIDANNCREGESIEYCKTHKVMHTLKSTPEFLRSFLDDQQTLKEIEDSISNETRSNTVYTIPVVFHVLHDNGPENISNEQIYDAVDILNRDYRLQNNDVNSVQSVFSGMPADIQIEFALAKKAPNGQCFSGITRTVSPLTNSGENGDSQVDAIIEGNDVYNYQWSGSRYLNIFVCADIGDAAGYTYTPSNWIGSSMYNGIWVLSDYVGSIGTSNTYNGRTLTHEVGHWLNLEHTWGPNNNPGNTNSCYDDDYVDDTPRCIGVNSCNLSSNSCSNDIIDGYWTSDVVDNVENYMDYSYCTKMFTNGQKNRMRAAIVSGVGGRNNLWQNTNLSFTGVSSPATVCQVAISSERDLICKGDMIQFFDESFNNIVSWNWSFPGATPASSNSQDPEVNYYTQGTYDVTLEVADQMGNSMSKTFEDYITVMNNYSSGFPYTESFENISSIPNDEWSVINENGPGFEISSEASFSGTHSVKLDNSSGSTGDIDELISQSIDLSNMISATISFKYAFAKRYSTNTDFLRVYASFNCGETWMLRKNISSSSLPTHPNTTTSYIPDDESWKTINIPGISSAYLVNNFRLKFEFNCGGGNDLFIDNININGVVTFGEDKVTKKISLFPNPTNNQVKLSCNFEPINSNISIDVLDESGRLLKRILNNEFKIGNKLIEFSVAELEKGLYFINVNGENQRDYMKLIKN